MIKTFTGYTPKMLSLKTLIEQIMLTDNGKRFPVEGQWDLMGPANKFSLKNLDAV